MRVQRKEISRVYLKANKLDKNSHSCFSDFVNF